MENYPLSEIWACEIVGFETRKVQVSWISLSFWVIAGEEILINDGDLQFTRFLLKGIASYVRAV